LRKFFYQVRLFKGSGDFPLGDLEQKINKFLKDNIQPRLGFTPSIGLADSGNVAMIMYMDEEGSDDDEEEES
jgi:hypothetical protein